MAFYGVAAERSTCCRSADRIAMRRMSMAAGTSCPRSVTAAACLFALTDVLHGARRNSVGMESQSHALSR